MARHSKNNTASSVFTYGERQKLKKSNEWGEIQARIGADSQKKFEQCNLCLKIVDDPLVCHKGHLFCKACIIENLFIQKQEIKKKLKLQKEENDKKQKLDKLNENIKNDIENFKKFEEGIVQTKLDSAIDESINFRNDEIQRYKEIEELRERRKIISTSEKNEKIKNCFWVPEKTPETKHNHNKGISDKLSCPVNYDHTIKLKELIKIKLVKHETRDKFICCICQKELSFQKIIASKNCGHVMCKKCYDEMCTKDKICGYCNEYIFSNDLIQLCESGSSFSEHNRVETNKLNPYFKY